MTDRFQPGDRVKLVKKYTYNGVDCPTQDVGATGSIDPAHFSVGRSYQAVCWDLHNPDGTLGSSHYVDINCLEHEEISPEELAEVYAILGAGPDDKCRHASISRQKGQSHWTCRACKTKFVTLVEARV